MNAPHDVVIVGGGFAGYSTARALKRIPVQVTLIDRRNFHLYAAKLIGCRLQGQSLLPFQYQDWGRMAVIGRNAAVADLGWLRIAGFPTWLLWLFIHLLYVVQFQNRFLALAQWMWNDITRNRSALLIPERRTGLSPGDDSATGLSRSAASEANDERS